MQMECAHSAPHDLWSACPPDILARCFKAQLDYTDNAGAGCASKCWNEIFRSCGAEVAVFQNPLNEGLLSSTYLRQFGDLHTVHLAKGADWQTQSGTWLTAQAKQYSWGAGEVAHWTETLQSVPASCRHLTLDGFLPHDQNFLSGFSQLLNLQQLQIRGGHEPVVDCGDLGGLQQLQSLSLIGQATAAVKVHGHLLDLPAGVTHLGLRFCDAVSDQMNEGFCLQELAHFDQLDHLDLSFATAHFGDASEVVHLRNLRTLLLECTNASCPQSVIASLGTATRLQHLVLRNFQLDEERFVVPLESLLSLPSLQTLDITSCPHINLLPGDCKGLNGFFVIPLQSADEHRRKSVQRIHTTIQAEKWPHSQAFVASRGAVSAFWIPTLGSDLAPECSNSFDNL